jgi:hypothetical protein
VEGVDASGMMADGILEMITSYASRILRAGFGVVTRTIDNRGM